MKDLGKAVEDFKSILYSSKQYEFRGTKLILTGYFTGKRVELDMAKLIDTEVLEDMLFVDDEDDEW